MEWKKAIGYIRVSTPGQATEDKYGISAQKEAITVYAMEHGYYVDKWVEEIGSGAKERPLMDDIVWGNSLDPDVSAVIVYKNDRVARETKLYFSYLYMLERRGVALISTQEEFDEGDEFASIYRALLQFVAEQERKNIKKRMEGGRKEKAKLGGYAGGKAPYGYKVEDGNLVIDEEEAKYVKEIFKRLDMGDSLQMVVDALNRMNAPTRTGKDWTRGTIQGIRNNRKTYEGYYRYADGGWVNGAHKAILGK